MKFDNESDFESTAISNVDHKSEFKTTERGIPSTIIQSML